MRVRATLTGNLTASSLVLGSPHSKYQRSYGGIYKHGRTEENRFVFLSSALFTQLSASFPSPPCVAVVPTNYAGVFGGQRRKRFEPDRGVPGTGGPLRCWRRQRGGAVWRVPIICSADAHCRGQVGYESRLQNGSQHCPPLVRKRRIGFSDLFFSSPPR